MPTEEIRVNVIADGLRSVVDELQRLNATTEEVSGGMVKLEDAIKDTDRTLDAYGASAEEASSEQIKFSRSTKAAEDRLKGFDGAAAKANRRNQGVAQNTANSTKAFAKMAQTLGIGKLSLISIYATFAANLFAATSAFLALKEAADFTVLVESSKRFSQQTGINLAGIAKSMQNITDSAITMQEALSNTSIATAAGLNTKTIQDLTKAASNASKSLGVDLSQALDRVFKGVIKGEPELLDELGIILRLDPATKKYAASIGKAQSELSAFERTQAVANEVLDQANKKFRSLDTLEANPYATLSASIKEASVAALEFLNKGLIPIGNKIADNLIPILSAIGSAIAFVFGNSLFKSITKTISIIKPLADRLGGLGLAVKKLSKLPSTLGLVSKALSLVSKATPLLAITALVTVIGVLISKSKEGAKAIKSLGDSLESVKAVTDAQKEFNNTLAQQPANFDNVIAKQTFFAGQMDTIASSTNDAAAALESAFRDTDIFSQVDEVGEGVQKLAKEFLKLPDSLITSELRASLAAIAADSSITREELLKYRDSLLSASEAQEKQQKSAANSAATLKQLATDIENADRSLVDSLRVKQTSVGIIAKSLTQVATDAAIQGSTVALISLIDGLSDAAKRALKIPQELLKQIKEVQKALEDVSKQKLEISPEIKFVTNENSFKRLTNIGFSEKLLEIFDKDLNSKISLNLRNISETTQTGIKKFLEDIKKPLTSKEFEQLKSAFLFTIPKNSDAFAIVEKLFAVIDRQRQVAEGVEQQTLLASKAIVGFESAQVSLSSEVEQLNKQLNDQADALAVLNLNAELANTKGLERLSILKKISAINIANIATQTENLPKATSPQSLAEQKLGLQIAKDLVSANLEKFKLLNDSIPKLKEDLKLAEELGSSTLIFSQRLEAAEAKRDSGASAVEVSLKIQGIQQKVLAEAINNTLLREKALIETRKEEIKLSQSSVGFAEAQFEALGSQIDALEAIRSLGIKIEKTDERRVLLAKEAAKRVEDSAAKGNFESSILAPAKKLRDLKREEQAIRQQSLPLEVKLAKTLSQQVDRSLEELEARKATAVAENKFGVEAKKVFESTKKTLEEIAKFSPTLAAARAEAQKLSSELQIADIQVSIDNVGKVGEDKAIAEALAAVKQKITLETKIQSGLEEKALAASKARNVETEKEARALGKINFQLTLRNEQEALQVSTTIALQKQQLILQGKSTKEIEQELAILQLLNTGRKVNIALLKQQQEINKENATLLKLSELSKTKVLQERELELIAQGKSVALTKDVLKIETLISQGIDLRIVQEEKSLILLRRKKEVALEINKIQDEARKIEAEFIKTQANKLKGLFGTLLNGTGEERTTGLKNFGESFFKDFQKKQADQLFNAITLGFREVAGSNDFGQALVKALDLDGGEDLKTADAVLSKVIKGDALQVRIVDDKKNSIVDRPASLIGDLLKPKDVTNELTVAEVFNAVLVGNALNVRMVDGTTENEDFAKTIANLTGANDNILTATVVKGTDETTGAVEDASTNAQQGSAEIVKAINNINTNTGSSLTSNSDSSGGLFSNLISTGKDFFVDKFTDFFTGNGGGASFFKSASSTFSKGFDSVKNFFSPSNSIGTGLNEGLKTSIFAADTFGVQAADSFSTQFAGSGITNIGNEIGLGLSAGIKGGEIAFDAFSTSGSTAIGNATFSGVEIDAITGAGVAGSGINIGSSFTQSAINPQTGQAVGLSVAEVAAANGPSFAQSVGSSFANAFASFVGSFIGNKVNESFTNADNFENVQQGEQFGAAAGASIGAAIGGPTPLGALFAGIGALIGTIAGGGAGSLFGGDNTPDLNIETGSKIPKDRFDRFEPLDEDFAITFTTELGRVGFLTQHDAFEDVADEEIKAYADNLKSLVERMDNIVAKRLDDTALISLQDKLAEFESKAEGPEDFAQDIATFLRVRYGTALSAIDAEFAHLFITLTDNVRGSLVPDITTGFLAVADALQAGVSEEVRDEVLKRIQDFALQFTTEGRHLDNFFTQVEVPNPLFDPGEEGSSATKLVNRFNNDIEDDLFAPFLTGITIFAKKYRTQVDKFNEISDLFTDTLTSLNKRVKGDIVLVFADVFGKLDRDIGLGTERFNKAVEALSETVNTAGGDMESFTIALQKMLLELSPGTLLLGNFESAVSAMFASADFLSGALTNAIEEADSAADASKKFRDNIAQALKSAAITSFINTIVSTLLSTFSGGLIEGLLSDLLAGDSEGANDKINELQENGQNLTENAALMADAFDKAIPAINAFASVVGQITDPLVQQLFTSTQDPSLDDKLNIAPENQDPIDQFDPRSLQKSVALLKFQRELNKNRELSEQALRDIVEKESLRLDILLAGNEITTLEIALRKEELDLTQQLAKEQASRANLISIQDTIDLSNLQIAITQAGVAAGATSEEIKTSIALGELINSQIKRANELTEEEILLELEAFRISVENARVLRDINAQREIEDTLLKGLISSAAALLAVTAPSQLSGAIATFEEDMISLGGAFVFLGDDLIDTEQKAILLAAGIEKFGAVTLEFASKFGSITDKLKLGFASLFTSQSFTGLANNIGSDTISEIFSTAFPTVEDYQEAAKIAEENGDLVLSTLIKSLALDQSNLGLLVADSSVESTVSAFNILGVSINGTEGDVNKLVSSLGLLSGGIDNFVNGLGQAIGVIFGEAAGKDFAQTIEKNNLASIISNTGVIQALPEEERQPFIDAVLDIDSVEDFGKVLQVVLQLAPEAALAVANYGVALFNQGELSDDAGESLIEFTANILETIKALEEANKNAKEQVKDIIDSFSLKGNSARKTLANIGTRLLENIATGFTIDQDGNLTIEATTLEEILKDAGLAQQAIIDTVREELELRQALVDALELFKDDLLDFRLQEGNTNLSFEERLNLSQEKFDSLLADALNSSDPEAQAEAIRDLIPAADDLIERIRLGFGETTEGNSLVQTIVDSLDKVADLDVSFDPTALEKEANRLLELININIEGLKEAIEDGTLVITGDFTDQPNLEFTPPDSSDIPIGDQEELPIPKGLEDILKISSGILSTLANTIGSQSYWEMIADIMSAPPVPLDVNLSDIIVTIPGLKGFTDALNVATAILNNAEVNTTAPIDPNFTPPTTISNTTTPPNPFLNIPNNNIGNNAPPGSPTPVDVINTDEFIGSVLGVGNSNAEGGDAGDSNDQLSEPFEEFFRNILRESNLFGGDEVAISGIVDALESNTEFRSGLAALNSITPETLGQLISTLNISALPGQLQEAIAGLGIDTANSLINTLGQVFNIDLLASQGKSLVANTSALVESIPLEVQALDNLNSEVRGVESRLDILISLVSASLGPVTSPSSFVSSITDSGASIGDAAVALNASDLFTQDEKDNFFGSTTAGENNTPLGDSIWWSELGQSTIKDFVEQLAPDWESIYDQAIDSGINSHQVGQAVGISGDDVNSFLDTVVAGFTPFATGTPFVPEDMPANVHKGEMIIDSESATILRDNGIKVDVTSSNEEVANLLKELIQVIRDTSNDSDTQRNESMNSLIDVIETGNLIPATAEVVI